MTEAQEKWLQALESGEFTQTTKALQRLDDGFCCLGVACEVASKEGVRVRRYTAAEDLLYSKRQAGRLVGGSLEEQPDVRKWLGLRSEAGEQYTNGEIANQLPALTTLNDVDRKTFPEIAAIIRANPERFFVNTEPGNVAASSGVG